MGVCGWGSHQRHGPSQRQPLSAGGPLRPPQDRCSQARLGPRPTRACPESPRPQYPGEGPQAPQADKATAVSSAHREAERSMAGPLQEAPRAAVGHTFPDPPSHPAGRHPRAHFTGGQTEAELSPRCPRTPGSRGRPGRAPPSARSTHGEGDGGRVDGVPVGQGRQVLHEAGDRLGAALWGQRRPSQANTGQPRGAA